MRSPGLERRYIGLPTRRKIILHVAVTAAVICISLIHDALHPWREPPVWLMLVLLVIIAAEVCMVRWSI